jgi:hypothetical protein
MRFPPRQLSTANALSNPSPLGRFTAIDIVITAVSALRQTGHRKYPGDHHSRDKKSEQDFLHNEISFSSSLKVSFCASPLEM